MGGKGVSLEEYLDGVLGVVELAGVQEETDMVPAAILSSL